MNIPKISVARYSSSLASRETPEQLAAQARIQAALAPFLNRERRAEYQRQYYAKRKSYGR